MIHKRFDDLARSLSNRPSRRHLLAGLSGSVLASSTARFPQVINAKRKRKRKKRKKQKPRFNDFGCVNVGDVCKTSEHCCSGICSGKKGKKRCQAHDVSSCEAEQTGAICGGANVTCTNVEGGDGTCYTTTGNAPYCSATGNCFPCAKDADCIPFCGLGAACIPCAAFCPTEGTMCAGPSIIDNCGFPP